MPLNALADSEGDHLAVFGNGIAFSQQAGGGGKAGISVQQTVKHQFLMPEEGRVGSRMLQGIHSAGVGVHGFVLAIDHPIQNVLLIGELVVADTIAGHIQM